MDLYNITTKIPYMIMLVVGLTLILNIYIGGLKDLSIDVDRASQQEYRQATILENILTLDVKPERTNISNYDARRAILPDEVVTNDYDSDKIGFKTREGHCYLEEIPNLNGEDFAFGVSPEDNLDKNAANPEEIHCRGPPPESSVWSPLLIEREDNPSVEMIIYVYKV